jgi:hypothetical protein
VLPRWPLCLLHRPDGANAGSSVKATTSARAALAPPLDAMLASSEIAPRPGAYLGHTAVNSAIVLRLFEASGASEDSAARTCLAGQ